MYTSDGQLNEESAPREGSIILRPSQTFHYTGRPFLNQSSINLGSFSTSYGLGEPPKGLKLLDHFQIPKSPDPKNPGQFIAGPISKVTVSDLNPLFIDASDNLITDTSSDGLQTCLKKLITTQFQNYLSNASNTAPTMNDRLRVALVDLTGDKLTRPDFAGWGSTLPMYGASLPKILAVYAAHQLRMDLRQLAITQGISSGKDLEQMAHKNWKLSGDGPDLVWLFDIRKWNGVANDLDFSAAAKNALTEIMHNHEAAQLIVGVGFPHIASTTFQSGLFHPTRGGLWVSDSYGGGKSGTNPVNATYVHNVTALSAATYFTLLAQRRLVDDAASTGIESSLRRGCITKYFPTKGVAASKCGYWGDYWNDCALIRRANARYVVVGLSRTKRSEFGKYTQLFNELDNLILRNNQTPKPGC